jgi:hypothetical protein
MCYIILHREINGSIGSQRFPRISSVGGHTVMTILITLFVVGWTAAAIIGTQAYFRGEQTKPIHERNWRSASFEKLATYVTGAETDYRDRAPAYGLDAYSSTTLPDA